MENNSHEGEKQGKSKNLIVQKSTLKFYNAAGQKSVYKAQSHNTKWREHVCLPVKRIFPTVKLLPQTPPVLQLIANER